jgi:transposase
VFTTAGYAVAEAEAVATSARRGQGKSDLLDAAAIARSVLGIEGDRLRIPRADGPRNALRVLLNARDSMTADKTATINQLTALARTDLPDVDARRPLTTAQIRAIAAWQARGNDPVDLAVARDEATRLARRIQDLTAALKANHARLQTLVADLMPDLLAAPGLGPVVAAQILISWSHPGRIRDEAAFAALAGVSPLPASSGNTTRHRLNRGGDRHLNRALHTIALTRMRSDSTTRAYVTRRLSQGKTKREIIRCLKRYIARQIYRQLQASATRPAAAA